MLQNQVTQKLMTIDDLVEMDQTLIDQNFWRTVTMTPRSNEAFRRSGVLPSEIIYPTLAMFQQKD